MGAAGVHVSSLAAGAAAALIASIWQGVLLTGCVAFCLRMAPRVSAGSRAVVWLIVFSTVGALGLAGLAGGMPAARAGGLHLDAGWGLGLAAVWVVLTTVRLGGLVAGAARLAGVARRATPSAGDVARKASRREPLVCSSAEVDRPGVVGFFSPRILLPEGLRERLSEAEFEAVLLHEREHLRRGDDWTNLLQKIGLALMPLNPVLVWVERRLCRERELACDDNVLRQTRARKVYAACLAHLAEEAMLRKPLALALGLAGRRSELGRRVHRILGQPEVVLGRRGAMAVCGLLIAGSLAGGIELARCPQMVWFVPRESSAAMTQMAGVTRNALFDDGSGARLVRTVARTEAPELRPGGVERHRKLSRRSHGNDAAGRVSAQRKGWVVMTRWTIEGAEGTALVPVGFVVPTESSSSSYAAVPLRSGWLVFQL